MPKPHQGVYKPLNPYKYKGNVNNVVYRSGLEFSVMRWLDRHPAVISWSSEEVIIAYRDPVQGRTRRYYPDFWIKVQDKTGLVKEFIWEIKPKKQTRNPGSIQPGQKPSKKFLTEVGTYINNKAKWDAAEEYCKLNGWIFKVITEDEIKGLK